jgi:hypothetical protein
MDDAPELGPVDTTEVDGIASVINIRNATNNVRQERQEIPLRLAAAWRKQFLYTKGRACHSA